MALLKIFQDKDSHFRFFLKTKNDILFFSEPFSSLQLCLKKVNYFKVYSRAEKNFKRLKAECGSYYFVFVNYGNNEIIGTSKSYLNKSSMENSISLIKLGINKLEVDYEVSLV